MIYNEKDIDPYCEGKTYNDVFYFLTLGITMVEKRIFVFGLAVVLALGTLGFNPVET